MKVVLVCVGKTVFDFVEEGMSLYGERIKHYCKFETLYIPAIKKNAALSESEIKEKEGEQILKQLDKRDAYVLLLDEKGTEYRSVEWASRLNRMLTSGGARKEVVFIIGGAYGFSPAVYERANEKLSLSKMTFSHQIVRLFFIEQLYRAFTIIKGEPYHHE